MAITDGVGAHYAFISLSGGQFPIITGNASIKGAKKTGTFSAEIPIGYPGVEDAFGPSLGDNSASVIVTTRGQEGTLITGEIDDCDFDYITGILSISGRDASAKLHANKSAEKWVNKQPQDIIQDIAGRVGLSAQVDPISLKASRIISDDWNHLTDGVSYATVLHKFAELMGANWYVNGSNLIVKSEDSTSEPYEINYDPGPPIFCDCLSLKIRRNIQAGKTLKVTTKSWHSRKKQKFTGESTVSGNGSEVNYSYHLPSLEQDHVQQHAKARANENAQHEVNVTAKMVGDPSMTDASRPLQLNGTPFAQAYKIDSIDHDFGMKGHTMTIAAKASLGGRSAS